MLLNPYINFDGNTRAAMNFYKECLGGELVLQTIGEAPFAAQMPAESHGRILHSVLTTDSIIIMGSDMIMEGLNVGNNVSLMLECDSEDQISDLYAKLSAEGEIRDALKEQFWGGIFGAITDKFGVQWVMNYAKK